jgi:hypothetical protein
MTRFRVVLPHLLPLNAVSLGNIVSNREIPTQSKYISPELHISPEDGNVLSTKSSSYKDLQQHDQGVGLSVLLSRIFEAEAAGDVSRKLTLETKEVWTHVLDDSDGVFAVVCEDVGFQIWLEKTIKKKDAYFVVGIQIITDAMMDIGNKTSAKANASATLATGQPGADVQAKASANNTREGDTHFVAEDKQIFAIQYRKIVFDMFDPKDAEYAQLSTKQTWVSQLKTRDNDDGGQPPKIRVALGDEEPVEGDFHVVSVREGDYFVASSGTITSLMTSQ